MKSETMKSYSDYSGGHLVGYFNATRREIESIFGEPTYTDNSKHEKVTVEWVIKFENGTFATIYDYKRYEQGTPKMDEVYEWHIGGENLEAARLVSEAMWREVTDFDVNPPSFRKPISFA